MRYSHPRDTSLDLTPARWFSPEIPCLTWPTSTTHLDRCDPMTRKCRPASSVSERCSAPAPRSSSRRGNPLSGRLFSVCRRVSRPASTPRLRTCSSLQVQEYDDYITVRGAAALMQGWVNVVCTPLLGTNTVPSGLHRLGLDRVHYLALGTIDGASPPS